MYHWCVFTGLISVDPYWQIICQNGCIDKVFSSVYCVEYYQATLMSKAFITMAALVWFLPSVIFRCSNMSHFLAKTFVTLDALIWFVSCMCSLVWCQLTVTGNTFATVAVLKFSPNMSCVVYSQTTLMSKTFTIMSAKIWFLTSVCFLVY